MNKYAYSAPDSARPRLWPNLIKEASKPYMGLTAFVAGQPRLVISYDGRNYQLEGQDGSVIELEQFIWDETLLNENNMLVAASRIASSPFAAGRIVNGASVGTLHFDQDVGEWTVLSEEGKSLSLMSLIDQLEASGWEIEEEVIYAPGESKPVETTEEPTGEANDVDSPEPAELSTASNWKTACADDQCPDCGGGHMQCSDCGYSMQPYDFRQGSHPSENESLTCPHCEGHSIDHLGVDKKDGNSQLRCHSCGEEFERKLVTPHASSLRDTDGHALIEGQWYTMLSPKYKVPDTVRLVRILDDEIHAAASTDDAAVPISIKLADIDDEGYTFEPLIVEPEHSHIDAHIAFEVLGRRAYSPSQQKDLIDEDGAARNASKLNLEGTHYRVAPEGTDDGDLGIFFLW